MANIASQIKRNRQNEHRRARNKAIKSAIKTRVKRFDAAVEEGDLEAAEAAYRAAASNLDRAARRGAVHARYAANRKARMARRLAAQ